MSGESNATLTQMIKHVFCGTLEEVIPYSIQVKLSKWISIWHPVSFKNLPFTCYHCNELGHISRECCGNSPCKGTTRTIKMEIISKITKTNCTSRHQTVTPLYQNQPTHKIKTRHNQICNRKLHKTYQCQLKPRLWISLGLQSSSQ